jgi:hypothetical protein
MKRMPFIAACLCIAAVNLASAGDSCDRRCLVTAMEQYLEALPSHNPSRARMAPGVRFVENTRKTDIGKGLWATASSGPGAFRIFVADPGAGQVGFFGVIEEKQRPVILGARLKLVDGKITEIDHLVARKPREQVLENFTKPCAGFLQPLNPSEKVSREQMLKTVNAYYESIIKSDGKLARFAPECQRRENGVITVNGPKQTPEEAAKDDFSIFRKMNCSDQMSSGIWSSITSIDPRRIIAVDEEMGLVLTFSIFRHNGKSRVLKISGVPGITERRNQYGAFDTIAGHIFKLRKGNIHEIEAIGYMAKYGSKSGWE